ncbi:hypothetical protein LTR91_026225 [Friedmanniomyces endolithicus]|uniref:Uncharacterized protein n=1 Tax=Friedmanniomyces endolithicus TaxID=329885 RepID=A0AAN6JVZ2_9PEZI|nr:hypothetical protein LTR75_006592 [Friedmanniomyces endolithicus]KAK0864295.1 hypothetical protein LTR87_015852 [Friedmanniomyces endolithicus]KAK0922416.1 hypothetical protein LTR57_007888 [Friedmanniomyces endolithicus]KAK0949712.1 hypothetical protein LTR91_026225 [Friedmanniomyces endolithicus]KAK0970347.1 hypothetical protein LTS01_015855 [Friedmanniomyces endolithicus]
MAASITFSLPLETVAAVQRAEGLEKALQDLSLTQTPEDSVIYDIARGVVNQANAVSHTDPSISVSKLDTHDPNLAVIIAERLSPRINEAIHLTIVDHATDEELDMIASPEDTLVAVTARYASILMRPHYNMTFSFEDGEKIPLYSLGSHRFQAYSNHDVHCAQTLRTLGITNQHRNVIHACVGTIFITVSDPTDLSRRDQMLTFPIAARFEELAHDYAQTVGAEVYELIFSIPIDFTRNLDITSSCEDLWQKSLHQLGITEGGYITVKSKIDTTYDMTFTVRDAMHTTKSFTLANFETVRTLDYMFQRPYSGTKDLDFELEGYVFSARSVGSHTLEQVGIYDGAVVHVRPYERVRQKHTTHITSFTLDDRRTNGSDSVRSLGGSVRHADLNSSKYGGWTGFGDLVCSRTGSPDSDTRNIIRDYARDQDPLIK